MKTVLVPPYHVTSMWFLAWALKKAGVQPVFPTDRLSNAMAGGNWITRNRLDIYHNISGVKTLIDIGDKVDAVLTYTNHLASFFQENVSFRTLIGYAATANYKGSDDTAGVILTRGNNIGIDKPNTFLWRCALPEVYGPYQDFRKTERKDSAVCTINNMKRSWPEHLNTITGMFKLLEDKGYHCARYDFF